MEAKRVTCPRPHVLQSELEVELKSSRKPASSPHPPHHALTVHGRVLCVMLYQHTKDSHGRGCLLSDETCSRSSQLNLCPESLGKGRVYSATLLGLDQRMKGVTTLTSLRLCIPSYKGDGSLPSHLSGLLWGWKQAIGVQAVCKLHDVRFKSDDGGANAWPVQE